MPGASPKDWVPGRAQAALLLAAPAAQFSGAARAGSPDNRIALGQGCKEPSQGHGHEDAAVALGGV